MSYLTVAEYVARFGAQETRLFTNTDPLNPIPSTDYNSATVQTSLDDATEEVEGYISRRYATPLVAPPKIVKGWVAAIARLKLADATGRVSDAIRLAADRVTRQLEQLVANKLDLPIETGDAVPAPNSTGDVMTSGDGPCPVFTGGALDSFTAPFTRTGGCLPRWRQ